MNRMLVRGFIGSVLAGLVVGLMFAVPAMAVTTKTEAKCASKLGKGGAKLAKTIIKGTSKCRDADISGKSPGSCPDSKTASKIAKASNKLVSGANKSCGSTCSVSNEVTCVSGSTCPPLGHLAVPAAELCSGYMGSAPFGMGNIGFPGAYCESALGKAIDTTTDLGNCVGALTADAAVSVLDVVYGDLSSSDAISAGAAKCLSGISKGFGKVVGIAQKGISKCRDSVNKGKMILNPEACLISDAKLQAKIGKMEAKLASSVSSKCTDAQILELDLCGQGQGGVLDRAAATACLTAAASEVAISVENPSARIYGPMSLVDAAYPPAAKCGDNVANQGQNAHFWLGEECDGDDDSACPGACFPPGDLWECTCGTVARLRTFKVQATADSDAGWTGVGQDASIADKAGSIFAVSGCDCDEFDGFTCTGNTSDSLCDAVGYQTPVCSWDPLGTVTCDSRGDGDGRSENTDCQVCDGFTASPGDYCVNEGDCTSQCYDSNGALTGNTCQRQTDCPTGAVCRGQCDRSPSCVEAIEGGPQPVSKSSSAVCAVQRFLANTTGTVDIVTGEFQQYSEMASKIHTGITVEIPCPVCGGFCVSDDPLVDGAVCTGTCSGGGEDCRYDSDCTADETCTSASRGCPDGHCNLSNVCRWGRNAEQVCTPHYEDAYFGTMSSDCQPDVGKNITGDGMIFLRWEGSPAFSWKAELPCTAGGYSNFDCHCPAGGGVATAPNSCGGACNAGAELGQGCANGGGFGMGEFTRCAAGASAGAACDEDSDCPGSTCSDNPSHCTGTGDSATERLPCTSDADCGLGSCVDACPSGRCGPMCTTAAGDDVHEGECAAGPPVYHCSGGKFVGRDCGTIEIVEECSSVCSDTGQSCESHYDCAWGAQCEGDCPKLEGCEAGLDGVMGTVDDSVGAGRCTEYPRNCMMDPITAVGGTTLNGLGDPTNFYQVSPVCLTATSNVGVNSGSGMPGPMRNRVHGVRIPNFTQLPLP